MYDDDTRTISGTDDTFEEGLFLEQYFLCAFAIRVTVKNQELINRTLGVFTTVLIKSKWRK